MCSIGACRMQVDTYKCSGCRKQFCAEGKQEGVFVDSWCLAATQKLLRDLLIGFAMGNGTLSSRLDQFHGQVTAFEDAKLFQNQHPCRSTRTLYNFCISFVRLLVCDPISSLFYCPTCQGGTFPPKKKDEACKVPRAICVDGIWAGYQKKTAMPFENVSEDCNPIKSFSRSVKSSFQKPRTSFLRLDKTVTFLTNAINGKLVEVNIGSFNALVSAIRLVDDTVLPSGFYCTSVCGSFPRDFKHDIGDSCLSKLRDLTCALFDKYTLLHRLLEPLQKLFQGQQGKRRKTGKPVSNKIQYKNAFDVVTNGIAGISALPQDEDGACWNQEVREEMLQGDFGKKTFQLFQALLQGPLTHLIRREEISSAMKLAQACIDDIPQDFMKAMLKKTSFLAANPGSTRGNAENSQHQANIVMNLRTLEGGLFSAAVVDKGNSGDPTRPNQLLPAFRHVIKQATELVSHFHVFYHTHVTKGGSTAAEYAKKWSSSEFRILRKSFVELSKSERFQPSWGADYDDPFVTVHTFLPSRKFGRFLSITRTPQEMRTMKRPSGFAPSTTYSEMHHSHQGP